MSPLGCLIGISSLMSSDWTLDLYHQVCSFSFLVLVNGTFIQPQVQGPCWCLQFCMPLGNPLWNPISLTAWRCIDLHLFLHLQPPPRPSHQCLSLRWHNSLITQVSLGIPRFMALCFIMLCRFMVFFSFFFLLFLFFFFFFYKLKVCGNLLSSKSFGTIFSTTFAYSCLYITFW